MGRLLAAEFRKIFTTKAWWALLIPTAVLAFAWSWIFSRVAAGLAQGASDALKGQFAAVLPNPDALDLNSMSWSVVALGRAICITTIIPMLFGALAMSSEINRRTITTSYLTAPNRGSLLGTKAITYLVFGVLFGIVTDAAASIGIVVGAPSQQLPTAAIWLSLALVGILLSVLMTLLGVGVGALLGSVVGSVVVLLLYMLVVENLVTLALPDHWPGILINGSADGLVNGLSAHTLTDQFIGILQNAANGRTLDQDNTNVISNILSALAGAKGAFDWWASGLIFAGWVAIFGVIGWVVSTRRDIT